MLFNSDYKFYFII